MSRGSGCMKEGSQIPSSSKKSMMSHWTPFSGSWATVKCSRLGIGQATWAWGGSWKQAQKLSLPQTSYSHFWRNWEKVSISCVNFSWLAVLSVTLSWKGFQGQTWLGRKACHDWLTMSVQVHDGVLWLACLEIYTAAFRREICYCLCKDRACSFSCKTWQLQKHTNK